MKKFKVSYQRRNSLINSPKNMIRSQVDGRNSSDEEPGKQRLLQQIKNSREFKTFKFCWCIFIYIDEM